MKILFELAKDHNTLPTSEVYCCLKAENIEYDIVEQNNDVIIIETNSTLEDINNLNYRLSSVFFVDRYLFGSSLDVKKITEKAEENPISVKGSIAVKYKNRSDKKINKGIKFM